MIKKVKIRDTRFIINIPVRKKNGIYVFVKQMMLPLQLDHNNNLVSYLNVFTIVDEYRGQPLRPRFFENSKNQRDLDSLRRKMEKEHKKIAASELAITKTQNFTLTEYELMNCYLENVNEDWKAKYLRGKGQKPVTIRTLINRSLLPKIQQLFIAPFLNQDGLIKSDNYDKYTEPLQGFEQAVMYLKKSGMLSVLFEYYKMRNRELFVNQLVNI